MARLIRNAVPIADVRFLARTVGHLFLFMEQTSVLPDFDDESAIDDVVEAGLPARLLSPATSTTGRTASSPSGTCPRCRGRPSPR